MPAQNIPSRGIHRRWPCKGWFRGLVRSGRLRNAAAETVTGLFKNEAEAKDSPFRTGPLMTESDVADLVVDWVHWYNFDRLHATLGYHTPVEFEKLYYNEMNFSLPDAAANKLVA